MSFNGLFYFLLCWNRGLFFPAGIWTLKCFAFWQLSLLLVCCLALKWWHMCSCHCFTSANICCFRVMFSSSVTQKMGCISIYHRLQNHLWVSMVKGFHPVICSHSSKCFYFCQDKLSQANAVTRHLPAVVTHSLTHWLRDAWMRDDVWESFCVKAAGLQSASPCWSYSSKQRGCFLCICVLNSWSTVLSS